MRFIQSCANRFRANQSRVSRSRLIVAAVFAFSLAFCGAEAQTNLKSSGSLLGRLLS